MDQQNIIFFGGLTLAVAVSAFILWGPSPRRRKKKGHIVGLVNLGSTCFLNTLLQALASCAIFIQWLNQQKHEPNSLTASLHSLLWVLNGEGSGDVHAPVEVLPALQRHGWMVPPGEQDAHELFHVIISTLQEENKKVSKAGSLSDALPVSDTLSQASDILDDTPELQFEINPDESVFHSNEDIFQNVNKHDKPKSKLGEGDNSISRMQAESSSSFETSLNYEDCVEKMNHGDSLSQSTTGVEFYSLEQNFSSLGDNINNCGDVDVDVDELTLKFHNEIPNNKENSLYPKSNLVKSYIHKFKASQESFRERSSDFTGCYDRATGGSPHIVQPDSPPFQGLLTSTLQCSACGHHSSVRYDTFDSLSLPLGENYYCQVQTLQDLLRKFVKTEIIPEVDCDKCCRKTTAFKTLNFGKLPTCLCLHIARTTWQTNSRTPTKRDDYVDFPEYLPMDEYTVAARLKKATSVKSLQAISSEDLCPNEKTYKHMYRLKSVVVHEGGVNSGHFLTYRRGALNTVRRHRIGKLAGACMDSQRWYLTSDDDVRLSSLCKAMDSLAYMLFYEKCSPEVLSTADDVNH